MWKYVASDDFDLDFLEGLRDFFEMDLWYAREEYQKYEKWQKYGLPNFRQGQLRRYMAIEDAQFNLQTCVRAIAVRKEHDGSE